MSDRFSPGDRVRVRADSKPGHIRTPVYIRGKLGVVTRIFGDFPNPEGLAGEIHRVRTRMEEELALETSQRRNFKML